MLVLSFDYFPFENNPSLSLLPGKGALPNRNGKLSLFLHRHARSRVRIPGVGNNRQVDTLGHLHHRKLIVDHHHAFDQVEARLLHTGGLFISKRSTQVSSRCWKITTPLDRRKWFSIFDNSSIDNSSISYLLFRGFARMVCILRPCFPPPVLFLPR